METLEQTDAHFRGLGATHYYDELFFSNVLALHPELHRIFTRHYFKENQEIGHVLPNLLKFGSGISYFGPPRVWDKMPILVALSE